MLSGRSSDETAGGASERPRRKEVSLKIQVPTFNEGSGSESETESEAEDSAHVVGELLDAVTLGQ